MLTSRRIFETVAIEDVQDAVRAAGHQAEIAEHDSGRRTLACATENAKYAVQFYPNEGHASNRFGALRFVAWFTADQSDVEFANAFNAKFRFASVVAQDDCYELQHDVVAIGVTHDYLRLCTEQWATSVDDFIDYEGPDEEV
ncbi:MAG: YbjN domain-containing protein [Deltaproteobacteria bacterium]|nr:YbjN domain-containing protein [Deltaproteobacteria bacterium]